MASRGSVIPVFLEQLLAGLPLTVTDPQMTRFMMTIEDAIELVRFAFTNARPGDLYVQKAPATTIDTLARAVLRVFGSDVGVRLIGTRHGEKLYETLLTREEMARAEDLEHYFRVPADTRDLNYDAFYSTGERALSDASDFHSHNARRLDLDEMTALLRELPLVKSALAEQQALAARRS